MATTREELEAYREKVFEELKVRTQRLNEIDTAIASNQYLLQRAGPSQALRSGNTVKILAGASHKAGLTREHERLLRQRKDAVSDVKKAEERLSDVDHELEELAMVETSGDSAGAGERKGDED
ncbi:MAG: hypothetical protein RL518_2089 [Pseudomonadota bacterium]